MKTTIFKPLFSLFAAAILIISSCKKDDIAAVVTPPPPPPPTPAPVIKPDIVFFGLTASNQLVRYNANASQMPQAQVAITGLAGGENLMAIDFRPATGQLYGLSTINRLYVINTETGTARAVGTGTFYTIS